MILILGRCFKGGINSVMEDRYVKSDDNKRILYRFANNIFGYALSESLL